MFAIEVTHPLKAELLCFISPWVFQYLRVLSMAPVKMTLSFWEKATARTSLECWANIFWVVKVGRSHSLAVLSHEPLMSLFEVELRARLETK